MLSLALAGRAKAQLAENLAALQKKAEEAAHRVPEGVKSANGTEVEGFFIAKGRMSAAGAALLLPFFDDGSAAAGENLAFFGLQDEEIFAAPC